MSDERTPEQALDDIRQAREQVFTRMDDWPWWYDAGYGGSMAIMVMGPGFAPPINILCLVLGLGILALIVRLWTSRTGVWINGYQPRRARWVAFGLVALLVPMILLSLYLGRQADLPWAPPLLGLAGGALAVIGSRLWMRVYRAEIRDLP